MQTSEKSHANGGWKNENIGLSAILILLYEYGDFFGGFVSIIIYSWLLVFFWGGKERTHVYDTLF